jgi:hypothetical protein
MTRDADSGGGGADLPGMALAEVSGLAFGVAVRGRLPADFAAFLRPPEAAAGPPRRDLEVAYRAVPRLAEVDEVWVAEPREPVTRDRFALFRQPEGFGLKVRAEDTGGPGSAGLFRIAPRRIDVEWLPGGAGAAHAFFTYALPLWLEARGVTVLHASAVALGGRVVAFVGPSGVGKSTLCAELVRAGGGFVADDGLALEEDAAGGWRCLPGPPWLRLWPSALEGRLGVAAAELPRVHQALDKRRLPAVGEPAAAAGGLPLAAVYLLERGPGADGGGAPAIDACTRRDALLRLVEHSLAAAPLAALGLAEERLDRLGRLAARVAVRRLRLPAGTDSTRRVRRAILADLGGPPHDETAEPIPPPPPPDPADAAPAPGAAPAAAPERLVPAPGVRARRVGEETVLLDLGSERYFALNEVGAEIWSGLERGLGAEAILAELLAAFDGEEERVRADLAALLAELLAEGLIRPADPA